TEAPRYSKSGEEECVQNPKDYYIKLLGKKKLGKIVRIKRIISHPEFNFSKVINDIALLELKEPLKCSKMTSPICLPTSEDLYENGQKLFIAGWGYYNLRKKPDRSNTILKEGVMKQVSSKKCMKPEVPKDTVRQYHCAVGTNHSACQGDSGTSTFIKYKKRFYTLGVVSHGTAKHCIPTYPTTFSKTLYFLDWIKEHVKDLPKP
ncbi:tryptase beta-2, partial [Trichonephila clavata]